MRFLSSSLSEYRSATARKRPLLGGLAVLVILLIAALVGFLIGPFSSRAQTNANATLALDMDPSGNAYDDATNSMTVGAVDFCVAGTSNDVQHNHTAHVIVRDVEDLIGWQARVNYDGGQIRPFSVNFSPFTDNNTGQAISFVNLPIDSSTTVHRDITSASQIPPQAAGPQSAAFGSTYLATQNAEVSPDTPPKAVSDGGAYSAPDGGVTASLIYQVLAGQAANNALTLDLDDDNPDAPGSGISYFDGTGSVQLNLTEFALGDGVHAEGGQCSQATPPPTTATPTSTPTPACPGIAVPAAPPLVANNVREQVLRTRFGVSAGIRTDTPTPTTGIPTPTACPPTPTPPPGTGGSFTPQNSSTYCKEGTGAIDQQRLTVSCQPEASAGAHSDIVSGFDLPAGDYNFGGIVNFAPTVPDDNAIPIGAVLGMLGSQPTLGILSNPCNNSQLRVSFTFMKGTTDNTDLVFPQPYGQNNDLAIIAGDNPPYGSQDVNPPPAATHYPSFLNAIFDPDWVDYGADKIAGNGDDNNGPAPALKPVFRAIGTSIIPSAGNLNVILQLVVFDKGTKLPNFPAIDPGYGYPSVVVLQTASASGSATPLAPSALTDFCTPLKTVGVSYGVTKDNPNTPANEGGIPVRTLPDAGTVIPGVAYAASQRDADGDGFENSLDSCPLNPDTVWNPHLPPQGDSDQFSGTPYPDGIPDTCDPTPTEATAGPPANQPTDHDGDGFPNRGDNCPLVANPDQKDSDINPATGDEVGDDIGDACDPNPGTPDGAEIKCVKTSAITVGGDPNVAYSDCLTSPPPPGTPTPPPTPSPSYGPGAYHPLFPVRILDTRSGPGTIGKVGPDGTRIVDVTGVGGVPASGVSAVVLNVTVTEPTDPSFLTVLPSPTALPLIEAPSPSTSNLNFTTGQTVANLVIVPVGADGNVRIYNKAGSVHVIVDVAGWYTGP